MTHIAHLTIGASTTGGILVLAHTDRDEAVRPHNRMKLTTNSLGALVWLIVLPALAGGQSLEDAAKKERDRRDKLREAGAGARTLTEEDLASNKGSLANDPKAKNPKGEDAESSTRANPTAASGSRRAGPAAPAKSGEEYWQGRVAQARSRVAEAQRRNDALQRMIHIGQPAMYDENGRRVIYSIYQMKELADAAAADLAAAQTALENVLEEGRRSGALPGWLR